MEPPVITIDWSRLSNELTLDSWHVWMNSLLRCWIILPL